MKSTVSTHEYLPSTLSVFPLDSTASTLAHNTKLLHFITKYFLTILILYSLVEMRIFPILLLWWSIGSCFSTPNEYVKFSKSVLEMIEKATKSDAVKNFEKFEKTREIVESLAGAGIFGLTIFEMISNFYEKEDKNGKFNFLLH